MNNNELFTVPEGFFEKSASDIMKKTARIRRTRRATLAGVAALGAALALFVTAGGSKMPVNYSYTAMADNDLAGIVAIDDNDIFLNTDF